jgi:O-antigen ligase
VVSGKSVRIIAACLGFVGITHLLAVLVSNYFANPATPDALIDSIPMTTLIVPNDAIILGLCLPPLAMILSGAGKYKTPVPWIAVSLFILFAGYASYLLQSKLSMLALTAATVVLLTTWPAPGRGDMSKRSRPLVAAGIFGMLLLLSATIWYSGNQSTTRLSLWTSAATSHDTATEVVFGAGSNTFYYDPNHVESDYDKGDYLIPWAHNAYLEAYYEQGLFGLAGILALTVIPIKRASQIQNRTARTLILGSMISFSLLALFEITLTRRFYFAYLAIMYGMARAQSKGAAK